MIAIVVVIVLATNLALTATSPSATATAVGRLRVAKAIAFDPRADGGDGTENSKRAKRTIDHDPKTVWRTEKYPTADFAGRKPGVGVVLDLGETRSVSGVKLQLQRIGGDLELRVPAIPVEAAPMKSVESWVEVGQAAVTTDALEISTDQPVQTRYLLIYFTALPSAGAGEYQNGIEEAVVLGH